MYKHVKAHEVQKQRKAQSVLLPDPPEGLDQWSVDHLAKCQHDDVEIASVFQWIDAGQLPSWEFIRSASPFTQSVYRQFDSLVVFDEVLYRTFVGNRG